MLARKNGYKTLFCMQYSLPERTHERPWKLLQVLGDDSQRCPLALDAVVEKSKVLLVIVAFVPGQKLDCQPVVLGDALDLLQKLDLFLGSEEVKSLLGQHHHRVGQLVTEKPCLQSINLSKYVIGCDWVRL